MLTTLALVALGAAFGAGDGTGLAASTAELPVADSPVLQGVAAGLRRARDPKAEGRAQLADEISALGSSAIPVLASILEARSLPGAYGEAPRTLNVHQEEILLAALERLGARASLRELEVRLSLSCEEPARIALLKGYGALGTHEHLARAFEISSGAPGEGDDLRASLRSALVGLLARDACSEPRLEVLWRQCPAELLPEIVFALGEVRDGRGLGLASDILTGHDQLLPLVAAQVPRIGRSPRFEVNLELSASLRREYERREPQLQAVILRALAALEDPQALELFVVAARSEERAVQSAALWSLARVSGLELGTSADAWEQWQAGESKWYESRYRVLEGELRSGDPPLVANAIREVAGHRVRRHEIAFEVADLLDHASPSLRALACRALAELGSSDSLPRLVGVLRDEQVEVARAAHAALRAITGRAYELDSPEWELLIADCSR